MLGDRPMSDWIARYTQSHQNPVNRACHTIGIPIVWQEIGRAHV